MTWTNNLFLCYPVVVAIQWDMTKKGCIKHRHAKKNTCWTLFSAWTKNPQNCAQSRITPISVQKQKIQLVARNIVQLNLFYCVDLVTPNMTQFSRLTQFLKVQLSKLSNFAKRFCISHLNVTFVDTVLSQLKLQTLQ